MHDNNTANAMPRAIRTLWKTTVARRAIETQKQATRALTRFTVTTCLHPSPSERAKSLSTLIAVIVNKDKPANTKPVISSGTSSNGLMTDNVQSAKDARWGPLPNLWRQGNRTKVLTADEGKTPSVENKWSQHSLERQLWKEGDL